MRVIALFTVAAALLASEARAQPNAAVQLPTFSFFSTSTTVSVPDGGSALPRSGTDTVVEVVKNENVGN
jgi:hypothetical protein